MARGCCLGKYMSVLKHSHQALSLLKKRKMRFAYEEILGVMICMHDCGFSPWVEGREVVIIILIRSCFFTQIHCIYFFLLLDMLGHPPFRCMYFPMKTCIPHTPTPPTQRQTLVLSLSLCCEQ